MPTIRQVEKDKTVGGLPLLPYSSMIANCFLWLVYGVLREEPKVWGTNLIGFLFGLFYFMRFIKFSPSKSPTLPGSVRQHVNVVLSLFAITLAFVYLSPVKDPAGLVGNAAVLFCVAMFGSPLAALKHVLETKSAKSIPLPFTVATVANCFLWSVTGLFDMKDANIYVPNLIGLAFGMAQVALKFIFGGGKPHGESELELLM